MKKIFALDLQSDNASFQFPGVQPNMQMPSNMQMPANMMTMMMQSMLVMMQQTSQNGGNFMQFMQGQGNDSSTAPTTPTTPWTKPPKLSAISNASPGSGGRKAPSVENLQSLTDGIATDDSQAGTGDQEEDLPEQQEPVAADAHVAAMHAAMQAPMKVLKRPASSKSKAAPKKPASNALKRPASAGTTMPELPEPYTGEVKNYSSRASYTSKYSHGTKKLCVDHGIPLEDARKIASGYVKKAGSVWDKVNR